jgi:predicted TIM-barrel fold metal-dependent hydrolase
VNIASLFNDAQVSAHISRVQNSMRDIYQRVREAADRVRIVDTHEHLIQEKERTSRRPDLFETFFTNYASEDLISSGMNPDDWEKVRDSKLTLEERWRILEPYWQKIHNTGYARALNIAARDLYGVDGITKDTYKILAFRMEEANKAGVYQWILKEKSRIDVSVLDTCFHYFRPGPSTRLDEVDRRFFAPVSRFDDFAMIRQRADLERLGKRCARPIRSFSDFIETLELEFEKASRLIVGVKIDLAYERNLRFERVSQREAEEVFANICNQQLFRTPLNEKEENWVPEGLSLRETKPLQDFMVHKIIQLAAKKGLVIQIHTGLQAGNENILTNSNPTLLVNLFSQYKEVRFDVFHGSYPYTGELAALAKNFPNVYIDMCWLHIISPFRARQALAEWLDTVPSNKIFGFGGDYASAEGVYGHSVIARQNIARVLAEKVEEGTFTEEQALRLSQQLLRDNAYEFFFSDRARLHDQKFGQ